MNALLWQSMSARFFRFAGAGAIGTAAHYAVLVLLVEVAAMSAAIAAAFGAVTGALVNYLLNYRYTFRSNARHTFTGPRFALIAIAGLALNSAVVFVFVRLGVHYLVGQVVATLLVLLFGFLANQFWTFSEAASDAPRDH
jgi:putative flippase GtrA